MFKFIFLAISFIPLFLSAQNAVTKQGESTASGTGFVDHNGRIVGYTALTRNGEILFPCEVPITDGRDGNVYQIVRIGDQCWMAENLKYLPSVVSITTSHPFQPYYYVYGYSGTNVNDAKATTNYNNYGVLYNWMTAVGVLMGSVSNPSGIQGVCPNGWHVPSQAEWEQLTNYLSANQQYWCDGNSSYIAKSLASTYDWNSGILCQVGNNQTTNNLTGFNALPGGYGIASSSTFWGINQQANFCTTKHMAGTLSLKYYLSASHSTVLFTSNGKDSPLSVRCIRNDCEYLPPPTSATHTTTPTSVIWNWNAVPHATGYKINTSNAYATATDIGNVTTYTQSVSNGNCGEFTLYIWAYSHCALSDVTTLKEYNYITDIRDANQYKTVQIGNQCWMKENLKYLTAVVGPATGHESVAYRYVYGYNGTNLADAKATTNYSTYGVLYNWTAAMNGSSSSSSNPSGVQGICPSGWHLPSDAEFTQLTDFLSANSTYWCAGVSTQIAKSIANTSGWISSGTTCAIGNSQTFNNTSGFTALPGGYRSGFGLFNALNEIAYYYTTTDFSGTPWNRRLFWNNTQVEKFGEIKSNGFSVRCVRN